MEKNKQKVQINIKIIYILLSLTVYFDAINGLTTMYLPGILEAMIPLIRITMLVYFIYVSSILSRKLFFKVVLISTFFISMTLLVNMINTSLGFSYIFNDIIYSSKLLFFYVLLNVLVKLAETEVNIGWFNRIFLNNVYGINLLIIVPTILGLSRQTYVSSKLGSMGFYIANNSTNITLIILSLVLVYNVWMIESKKKINVIFLFISIYTLWLQSSKSSLIIIILIIILNLFFLLRRIFLNRKFTKKEVVLLWLFTLLTFILIIVMYFYKELFRNIAEYIGKDFYLRQKYQVKNFSNNKILYFTSGRLLFLKSIIEYFRENNSIFNWFTGVGISNVRESVGKLSEMDFFDIFFVSGFIGIYISYLTSFYHIKYYPHDNKYNFTSKYINMLIFIVILFSLFAGHVYVDIISSTFLALLIATTNCNKKDEFNENIINFKYVS